MSFIVLNDSRAGRLASLVLLAGLAQAPRLASAQENRIPAPAELPPRGPESDLDRPHGAVEFGIGVLALPDAEVCGGDAGCDRGDVSLEVDAWPLFRASPQFAVGAGITLALTPAQDVPSTNTTFPREHSRRYFMVEGVGRYYFVHGRVAELWTGISAGLVVVSDNFESAADTTLPIIGSGSANIATEGSTVGLAAGVTFGISRVLQLGGTLRVANWFLPSTPRQLAFEEQASLSDRVTMINLAVTLAYHAH